MDIGRTNITIAHGRITVITIDPIITIQDTVDMDIGATKNATVATITKVAATKVAATTGTIAMANTAKVLENLVK